MLLFSYRTKRNENMLRRSSRFDTLRGVRGKSFRRMMRNVKIALTNYNPFSDFFFPPALARAQHRSRHRKSRKTSSTAVQRREICRFKFFFIFFHACLTSKPFRLLVNLSLMARSMLAFDVLSLSFSRLVTFSTLLIVSIDSTFS